LSLKESKTMSDYIMEKVLKDVDMDKEDYLIKD